jgi:hypothetical protein
MESISPIETEPKKTPRDRIILDPATVEIVERQIDIVRRKVGEIVTVSPKQMANFILQSRSIDLLDDEIDQIKVQFADKLKVLQTILERAKLAKREGRNHSIDEEIEIFKTLSVSENSRPRRGRKRSIQSDSQPDVVGNSPTDSGDLGHPTSDAGNDIKSLSPIRRKSKSKTDSAGEIDLEVSS